jgi:hypothetical protein
MTSLSVDVDAFDLDAAVLRRSETDLRAFMAALAVRLEGALPQRVSVSRRRVGLFSGETFVAGLVLMGESARYDINIDRGGVRSQKAKLVRGVVISSHDLPLAEWLGELKAEVARLAGQAGDSTGVLHDFL